MGEELLIIQKEFDGFDETRERLDLLALDKNGNLVLIENKLDDSGKDVVWQSLKYASYCSSLKKADIERIFQGYLNRYQGGGNARELICEFLEAEDFSDVILNSGTEQRIKLVAANFRKEVTSTVLWLLQYNLQIQCYKATPFQHGENLFLNFEQIIPTPEAADFMIGIAEKENEEKTVKRQKAGRYELRHDFWEATLKALDSASVPLFQNVRPSQDHWLSTGSGLGGITYVMVFSKTEARVELYISRADKDSNKALFDTLEGSREQIEVQFGEALVWQRLDDKKACRIKFSKEFDSYDRENWQEMTAWLVKYIVKLEGAFNGQLGALKNL
ncbi:MAG: hypothetical protein ACI8T1_002857 [Verrucomicrobiales bacterium]